MNKKKIYKGEYGYILGRRKRGLLISIISLCLTIFIYLVGYFMNGGNNQNVFSIIAALGCLPTGWAVVNTVMFYRALPCSENVYKEIQQHKGQLVLLYDLELTSEKTNFSIAACTELEHNVICFTERQELDERDCEAHIKNQIAQSGYHDYTIKVFHDLKKFCNRLDELEQMRQSHNLDPQAKEDAWVPGTTQTVLGIMQSISL